MYSEFWNGPVFPAMLKYSDRRYLHNATLPGVLGYVYNGFMHDWNLSQSWNWPKKRKDSWSPSLSYPSFDEFDGAATHLGSCSISTLQCHLALCFWKVIDGGRMGLGAKSHCNEMYTSRSTVRAMESGSPPIIRNFFLALLQYSVLDIVRDRDPPQWFRNLARVYNVHRKFKNFATWENSKT